MKGCKLALCGRDFRPRRNEDLARNPNHALLWPDARTGRHGRNCFIGYVRANHGKIVVFHFQDLRAMIATFAEVGTVSAKSFDKHGETMLLSISLVNGKMR